MALPVTARPWLRTMADVGRGRGASRRALARPPGPRRASSGPAEVDDVARTLRTPSATSSSTAARPALQPGPRAYARSWIRDGALTSSALLRLGQDDVAREFLLWFAPFQFQSGKVPCCATARGADPVPENDSDGEFAFAAAELWQLHPRRERGACAVAARAPRGRAHGALRASERTDANRHAERRAYFGLMPPSISHEGYSDKPAYSYWDDFWAAIGYRSAVELARALGLADDATAHRRAARRVPRRPAGVALRQHAAARPRRAARVRPTAATVDPTSSTIALSPGGLLGTLPDALVRNTFERYWRDFSERSDSGDAPWDAYTPYEWRNGRQPRAAGRARARAAGDGLLLPRPPAERMEPVGRGGAARCTRAALPRRHAARLGRVGPDPLGARPVRVRARRRTIAGPRGRHPDGMVRRSAA